MRPVVIPKTLQVVSIACWLICAGCQRNSAALSPSAYNDPAIVEFSQQNESSRAIDAVKKNLDEDTIKPTVIAYYFHPTIRCIACITVESIAAETIEEAFREQLADGRLVWMRINIDEKHSEDYEKQFDVSGSALVIAELDGGNNMQYKKLTKVWELLSQPQALSEYIKNEINEYLSR
jgi:hypothetical protein